MARESGRNGGVIEARRRILSQQEVPLGPRRHLRFERCVWRERAAIRGIIRWRVRREMRRRLRACRWSISGSTRAERRAVCVSVFWRERALERAFVYSLSRRVGWRRVRARVVAHKLRTCTCTCTKKMSYYESTFRSSFGRPKRIGSAQCAGRHRPAHALESRIGCRHA